MQQRDIRVLFVCVGNTCRSPMAAGLAHTMLGPHVQVDSAGIAVSGEEAAPEAVQIMHELFGIDLTNHRPRDVAAYDVAHYDAIVTLDTSVYAYLLAMYPQLESVVLQWQIADPYLEPVDAYRQCARSLQAQVQGLLPILLRMPAPAAPVPCPGRDDEADRYI
jgi:protein-tyrosine-phosphatase